MYSTRISEFSTKINYYISIFIYIVYIFIKIHILSSFLYVNFAKLANPHLKKFTKYSSLIDLQ